MCTRTAISLTLLALALFLSACDDKRPSAGQGTTAPLTIRGLLTRSAGIGGETTGWIVVLDQSVEVEGQKLNMLEVEFDAARWPMQEDTPVEVTGWIAYRTGVERGRYPILCVERIKLLPKGS